MFILSVGSNTVLLPDPEFDNSEALKLGVNSRRSISGSHYVTIKKTTERTLQYEFRNVPRADLLRVRDITRQNTASTYILTDHNSIQWQAKIIEPIFSDEIDTPAVESGNFSISFRGHKS